MYRKVLLRPPEVYGITGNKGHGKDTFARLVLKANASQSEVRRGTAKATFKVYHFADALKRMSGRIFGLTDEQMHDPAIKELPLPVPIQMDLYLDAMRSETGLAVQPAGKVARTPREVMQYFGTDYVRRTQNDYWVQRLLRDVGGTRRALVPDTRFENETEAIRSVGGRTIKVVRIDLEAPVDGHASETEMAGIEPDLLLGVRTGDLSLPERVANLVALGKFDAACRYDYRRVKEAIAAYVSGKTLEESALLLGQNHKHPYALRNALEYYGVPLRKQPKNRVPHRVLNGVTEKKCGKCEEWKPIREYNAGSKFWDGLSGICRSCSARANQQR